MDGKTERSLFESENDNSDNTNASNETREKSTPTPYQTSNDVKDTDIPKATSEGSYGKNNRTFRFYEDKKTFAEAEKFCKEAGLQLATVLDADMNDFVMSLTDKPFWIGGKQKGWAWKWRSDHNILLYKPFEKQVPMLQGCLEVSSVGSKPWKEKDCDEKKGFVCETLKTYVSSCMWCRQ